MHTFYNLWLTSCLQNSVGLLCSRLPALHCNVCANEPAPTGPDLCVFSGNTPLLCTATLGMCVSVNQPPQGLMVAELVLERVAAVVNQSPLAVREPMLYREGDVTHFGMVRASTCLASML